ncbi:MAG: hypothetical protein ACYDH5_05565 [Acidimicrobiales bacterium]
MWLEALGAALGTVKFVGAPTDLVTHLLPAALGAMTMVAVVLGTLMANVLNIYSGVLSSLVLGIPMRRWVAAVVVGTLGTVVSWSSGQHNYWQHYEVFLFLLGYWVAPWLAILSVDYLIGTPAKATDAGGRLYGKSHRVGLGFAVWVVAVLASVPFMNQPSTTPGGFGFVGPFAASHPSFGDITYFVSFLVAGVLYALALKATGGRSGAEVEAFAD